MMGVGFHTSNYTATCLTQHTLLLYAAMEQQLSFNDYLDSAMLDTTNEDSSSDHEVQQESTEQPISLL